MKRLVCLLLTCVVWLAATACPGTVSAEKMVYPGDKSTNGILNVKTDFGAKGDGKTDDSDALEAALNSKESMDVFFPAGTYRVTRPIKYRYKRFMVHGEEMSKTVIKLDDSAPGFQDGDYKALLYPNEEGNKDTFIFDAFMLGFYNLTIDVGAGNPIATAVKFTANNQGGMRDVTIRSSDADGAGGIGIDLTRQWPGPALLKNVTVEGFDYGVRTYHTEYGMTIENMRLKNQRICGIYNENNELHIDHLASINTVPALQSVGASAVISLLNAELAGAGGGVPAVSVMQGRFYGRNLKKFGYDTLLSDQTNGKKFTEDTLKEYSSDGVYKLFEDSPDRMLMLPYTEAPVVDYGPPGEWVNVMDFGADPNDGADDSKSIQAAIDSGAEVIYLPRLENGDLSGWHIGDTVHIRGNVKAIVGCVSKFHVLNGMDSGEKPLFRFEDGSADSVTFENIWFHSTVGNAWLFDVDTSRNVQIRNILSSAWGGDVAGNTGYDLTAAGSGTLFLEDVCIGSVYVKDKVVLASQLNLEEDARAGGTPEAKVYNDGGQVRILGYKTERSGCVLKTVNGGKSEVIGALIYPVRACDPNDAMIQSVDSAVSVVLGSDSYNASQAYETIISEIRGGTERKFLRGDLPGRTGYGNVVCFYSGYSPEQLDDVRIPKPVVQPAEEDFDWSAGTFNHVFRSGCQAKEDGSVRVVYNEVELFFDVQPQIYKGRTMVPIRPVCTALGASVSWDDENQAAAVKQGEKEIVVTVGSETAYVDGAEVELDAPALEMDGRTMVPLRFLGESFGIKVQWDDEAKTAVLSSQG